MSSNAATLGEAALACCDLSALVSSAVVIAALSLLAVRGSLEPYAPAVHRGRPAGQQRVAGRMRALLSGPSHPPARIQDSYGYRAFPQVHGPAVDALGYAGQVVSTELNGSSENPLVDPPATRSGTTATSTPPTSGWPSTRPVRRCSRPPRCPRPGSGRWSSRPSPACTRSPRTPRPARAS